jgi:hypothetical protein
MIEEILTNTPFANTLESLSLLNSRRSVCIFPQATLERPMSLACPNLRHLTFSLSAGCISDCVLRPSQLTSLHIVIDTAPMFNESAKNITYRPEILPNLVSLRHYTISGGNDHVLADTLLPNVFPILQHSSKLLSLTVRDMKMVVDISYVPRSQSNGHVEILTFDNVQYCMTDEITLSGPSKPKELDGRCKPYVELVGYADQSCIIPGTS